jgi:hypothetical protein
MLAFQRTIYDDFLTGVGTVDLSSGLYDQLLGLPDELEVAITADQVGASTLTLTVIAEHSGDGRNWKTLGSTLRSGTLSTTQTDVTIAAVTGGPALGNVRFNLTLGGSGTPASARVRLSVAARDHAHALIDAERRPSSEPPSARPLGPADSREVGASLDEPAGTPLPSHHPDLIDPRVAHGRARPDRRVPGKVDLTTPRVLYVSNQMEGTRGPRTRRLSPLVLPPPRLEHLPDSDLAMFGLSQEMLARTARADTSRAVATDSGIPRQANATGAFPPPDSSEPKERRLPPTSDWQNFDRRLMRYMTALKPFGFAYAVGVRHPDDTISLVSHNHFGWRSAPVLSDVPFQNMSIDTLSEIDSFSKHVTAVAVMKTIGLIPNIKDAFRAVRASSPGSSAEARWKLEIKSVVDRSIGDFVPWMLAQANAQASQTITISDLIRMVAGFGGPNFLMSATDLQSALSQWTFHAHTNDSMSRPYSNGDYALLRYVLLYLFTFVERDFLPAIQLLEEFGDAATLKYAWGTLYCIVVQSLLFQGHGPISPGLLLSPAGVFLDALYFDSTGNAALDIAAGAVDDFLANPGAYGWKMSIRMYLTFLLQTMNGDILPKEYFRLMRLGILSDGKYAWGSQMIADPTGRNTFVVHTGARSDSSVVGQNLVYGPLDVAAGGGWMIANENVAFVFRMTSMGYGMQDVLGGTSASTSLETQLFAVLNEVVRLMGILL